VPHREEAIRHAFAGLFTIEHELGHGGMAYVFQARRVTDGTEVAVKVIRPELAVGIGYARFQREIALLQPLEHPHIFPLLEAGERGLYLYYVMPCAAGGSLRSHLRAAGPLPQADALALAAQIGSALDYAHGRALLHRDIKPENILRDGTRWVLCDFGVARAMEAAVSESLSPSGLIIGTPQYMSPEQGQASKKIDHRSDLYAFGCVLYEALAGHPPFTGATPQAIITRHAKERVPKLRLARPDMPAHVEAAIEWRLAKQPKERPRNAAQAVKALQGP